jgi:hypothetical protein
MTIEQYLDELRRRLLGGPRFLRRVLAEVEDHLRDSAGAVGEDQAIARMGPPRDLARDFAPQAAEAASSLAVWLLVLCLGGFVAAYVVSENTLPPAPWPSADAAPAFLRWTTTAAGWSFAAAAALAGVALVLSMMRKTPTALAASCACALALTLACAAGLAAGMHRATLYDDLAVADRWSPLEILAGELYLLALASVALGGAAWASRVWLTARRASIS